jgi:hypothetical protein
MFSRIALLAPIAALLMAAAIPPPPSVLAPYIHGDRFDPGDYGWMRGHFDDASPADKAAFLLIFQWRKACAALGEAELRAQLAAMGIAHPDLARAPAGGLACYEVGVAMPNAIDQRSFATFQRSLAEAQPVVDGFLFATTLAERSAAEAGPTLGESLLTRPVGEQTLRYAWSWGGGTASAAPPLSHDAQAIAKARIIVATAERDHANTEWLEAVVAKQGWPTISKVGKSASNQAWLLVQHADADPAFQLRALRLMEPLVPKGEVAKPNYALLYDRVMLKLVGKQRYGSQMTCENGVWQPLPLEDPARVDQLRAALGMESMAENMQRITRDYSCRSDPAGRASTKG